MKPHRIEANSQRSPTPLPAAALDELDGAALDRLQDAIAAGEINDAELAAGDWRRFKGTSAAVNNECHAHVSTDVHVAAANIALVPLAIDRIADGEWMKFDRATIIAMHGAGIVTAIAAVYFLARLYARQRKDDRRPDERARRGRNRSLIEAGEVLVPLSRIAAELGRPDATVRSAMAALAQKGFARHLGRGRWGILAPNGAPYATRKRSSTNEK